MLANLVTDTQELKVEQGVVQEKGKGKSDQFDSLLSIYYCGQQGKSSEVVLPSDEASEKEKLKMKGSLLNLVLPVDVGVLPVQNQNVTPEDTSSIAIVSDDIQVYQGDIQAEETSVNLDLIPMEYKETLAEADVNVETMSETEPPLDKTLALGNSKDSAPVVMGDNFNLHEVAREKQVAQPSKDGQDVLVHVLRNNETDPSPIPAMEQVQKVSKGFEFPRDMSLRHLAKTRQKAAETNNQTSAQVSAAELEMEPENHNIFAEVGQLVEELDLKSNLEQQPIPKLVNALQQRVASKVMDPKEQVVGEISEQEPVAEFSRQKPQEMEGTKATTQGDNIVRTSKAENRIRSEMPRDTQISGKRTFDFDSRVALPQIDGPEARVEGTQVDDFEIEPQIKAILDFQDREAAFPKLVQNIQSLVQGERSEVRIQLKPDHLGELKIKLSMEQGIMMAEFVVESEAVKEVLASHLPQLHTALQEQGTHVAELMVNIGFSHKEHEEERQPRSRNFSQQARTPLRDSGGVQTGEKAYLGRSPWNRVDLKV